MQLVSKSTRGYRFPRAGRKSKRAPQPHGSCSAVSHDMRASVQVIMWKSLEGRVEDGVSGDRPIHFPYSIFKADRLIDSFQNSSYNGSSKLFPSLANGGSSHNGSPDMRNNMNNRRFDHHLPTI